MEQRQIDESIGIRKYAPASRLMLHTFRFLL
jgi:hypothetical protein